MHKHSFVPQQAEKKSLSIKYGREKKISTPNNTTHVVLQIYMRMRLTEKKSITKGSQKPSKQTLQNFQAV